MQFTNKGEHGPSKQKVAKGLRHARDFAYKENKERIT
jgi:hypothetical protein